MKQTVLTLFFITCSIAGCAQNKSKTEVMTVINDVFEAMRTNDSTLLKSCFTENPNMFTSMANTKGESALTKGDFQRFVSAVGRPKEQVWNEPIWNEVVQVDDNLASVWVDYAFYVDEQFSHCGVDAFHLIKQDGKWKIFHLVDTRRKEPCEVPEYLKP